MDKTNIMQENLCIQKIDSVIKGKNCQYRKLLKNNGRHSDAFVYILEGSCTYRFDDKIEFTATTGDVFYLPRQSVYSMFIHTQSYEFIFCDFEFADSSPKHSALYSHQDLNHIDSLFYKLLNRYHASSGNTYAECMSILYHIYSLLQQHTEQGYLSKDKKDDMASAKRYMDEHLSQPELSISLLAEQCNVSEVYFRKLFKARYGLPPSKYLASIRLKNATKLMNYPFLTLDECALQSGFSSLQYFCRLFKKETGISPGKFRKGL